MSLRPVVGWPEVTDTSGIAGCGSASTAVWWECRYCNEIARHALEILQVATLMPECRRSLLTAAHAQADGQTDGIAAILEAAHGQAYLNDPEVSGSARDMQGNSSAGMQ